jgi:hypothetical protein
MFGITFGPQQQSERGIIGNPLVRTGLAIDLKFFVLSLCNIDQKYKFLFIGEFFKVFGHQNPGSGSGTALNQCGSTTLHKADQNSPFTPYWKVSFCKLFMRIFRVRN